MVQTELFCSSYAHRADALELFVREVAPPSAGRGRGSRNRDSGNGALEDIESRGRKSRDSEPSPPATPRRELLGRAEHLEVVLHAVLHQIPGRDRLIVGLLRDTNRDPAATGSSVQTSGHSTCGEF